MFDDFDSSAREFLTAKQLEILVKLRKSGTADFSRNDYVHLSVIRRNCRKVLKHYDVARRIFVEIDERMDEIPAQARGRRAPLALLDKREQAGSEENARWCGVPKLTEGVCSHDCSYCYVKRFGNLKELRLDESEFKTDLGQGNFIFVGSSTDMFAESVPFAWTKRILDYCKGFDNRYLFQSKNPERMALFTLHFPKNSVLGTTIESNRDYADISKAPPVKDRAYWLKQLGNAYETMVTVEPVLDFDTDELVNIIKGIGPSWVNVGADSKGHGLPEPGPEKISALIDGLGEFTEVKIKNNLKRLMKQKED